MRTAMPAGGLRLEVWGAGVIGLACADELVARGHSVTVVDPAPFSGASRVAAGMLTPAGEAWAGERATFTLGVEAAALWPAWARRLGVTRHRTGTLLVARDAGDVRELERRRALLAAWGSPAALLDAAEVPRLEPSLGAVGAALLLPDASVDPRDVVLALRTSLDARGVRVVPAPCGVASTGERGDVAPDARVVATGWELPHPWRDLVRPVRGELLVLRPEVGFVPRHVVRGWVAGEQVYLVPREDGRVVVGATSEEHDGPAAVTAGGLFRLLRAARALAPGLDTAHVLETLAGNRPATPDHLPLLGRAPGEAPDGVATWLAGGTFRHGVLLAPLMARLLADQVERGACDPGLAPALRPALDPARFAALMTSDPARPDDEEERCE